MRNNTTKKIINLEGKVIVKGYFNGISIIEIRTTDEIAYSGAEVAYSQAHKVAVSDIKPKNVQLCRNFMVFEAGFRDKPKTPHPTLDRILRNFRSYRKISDRYDSLYVEGISAKHRLERNNGKIVSFFDKD